MPVKYLAGTFEGKPHYRWTKMHDGTRYRVKCSDLGLPEHLWTKEGSREAANAWWRAKLAELTASDPVAAAFKRVVEAKPVAELIKDVERGWKPAASLSPCRSRKRSSLTRSTSL